MAWNVPSDPDAPLEAIRWFRARVPMTDAQFEELKTKSRRKAFTVAGVAELDLVHETHAAIERAITDGTDLAEFKKAVGEKLRKAWSFSEKATADRLETIFRTNVQLAYGAGRYE